MKRVVFSRYTIDEDVTVKHTYHQFTEGETVTVTNPQKVQDGNEYFIEVENAHGERGEIPTKLIKKISNKHKYSQSVTGKSA